MRQTYTKLFSSLTFVLSAPNIAIITLIKIRELQK